MEYLATLQDGIDDQKPSLFEVLSEQQLSALIPPSLRYLLALLTHRHPRYLLRVLNSFDELYALLSLLIERHYLSNFSGSFTENFYGLKRERVLRTKHGELPRAQLATPDLVRETLKLRRADVWANLVVLVGIPYVKRKLDESYDIHVPSSSLLAVNFDRDRLPANPSLRERVFYHYKQFLRKVYPSLNLAYYFSLLAFNLAYLFDNTKYSSPFLWLIGTRVRRLGRADYTAFAQEASKPPSRSTRSGPASSTLLQSSFLSPQTLYPRALSSLKLLLPASIFALKFLEWWHASDFARQLSRKATEGQESLPLPTISYYPDQSPSASKSASPSSSTSKPLSKPSSSKSSSKAKARISKKAPISTKTNLPIYTVAPPTSSTSSLCPICLGPIVTPTACQTGFVYCYVCIFKWIDGSHESQTAFMDGKDPATRRRAAAMATAAKRRRQSGKNDALGRLDDLDTDENENEKERIPDDDDDGNGDWANDGNYDDYEEEEYGDQDDSINTTRSRHGRWESGVGRCAVSARRVLGGTQGLRRIMV